MQQLACDGGKLSGAKEAIVRFLQHSATPPAPTCSSKDSFRAASPAETAGVVSQKSGTLQQLPVVRLACLLWPDPRAASAQRRETDPTSALVPRW